jgi:hypothetical protein
MAEQSGERQVPEDAGAALISSMAGDMDPELVELALSCVVRSAAGGRADHEGHRGGGGGEPPAGLLQEYAELLALIRDAGLSRAQLRAILGLNPETRPAGDDPDTVTDRVLLDAPWPVIENDQHERVHARYARLDG